MTISHTLREALKQHDQLKKAQFQRAIDQKRAQAAQQHLATVRAAIRAMTQGEPTIVVQQPRALTALPVLPFVPPTPPRVLSVTERWEAALQPFKAGRTAYAAIVACAKAHPALYAEWRES